MSNQFIQLQITYPQKQEAMEAARYLTESGLVACAQVTGPIESFYRWQGNLHNDREWLLLAKTDLDYFSKVKVAITKKHSYECPQIIALPIQSLSESYQDWLEEQLQEGASSVQEELKNKKSV